LRYGGRRPGTDISFVDSTSGERYLHVTTSEQGEILIAYTLYDSEGQLVADSDGPHADVAGKEVRDENNELLLLIPLLEEDHIQYRLYNDKGALLTCSDGARTQLFGGIRLESTKLAPSQLRTPPRTPTVSSPTTMGSPIEATLVKNVQPLPSSA